MSVIIIPFGRFTDFMDNPTVLQEVSDTDALKEKLLCQHPELKDATFLLAVNRQVIKENKILHENDEVAIMPPFAGG